MKKLNNNGITLMALVITIIILIILASIGTYSGIQVVKSAQFTAFSTELKIMQTQVNKLYEEKKNGNSDVDALGKTISSSSTTVQSHATKAFNASGITDTSDYKYFDTDTIKSLNIEGVEGEFFVNVDKRSVASYDGFEYEGKTYYTLEQLPDRLYNVEHNISQEQPDFDVDYELLENGKYKITVSNINYNGNINKWKVEYKKENEDEWKQTNSYSFTIDEVGNYRVKIANNNTESREKQIVVDDYQQVEYIESTGTQYINTNLISSNDIFEFVASVESNQTSEKTNQTALFGSTNGFNVSILSNRYRATAQCITNINIKSNEFDEIDFISNPNKSQVYLKINDYEQTGTYSNFKLGNSIGVFAYGTGEAKSSYKLKLFKILVNDELKVYFIPCYRKSDRKPGLFDLVEGRFYTNQGTGDFETGKDIDSGETINTIIINNL